MTIIAHLEVKVFKETSSSLSDADFLGVKKVEKRIFFKRVLRFDHNVLNDSKHILESCFGPYSRHGRSWLQIKLAETSAG